MTPRQATVWQGAGTFTQPVDLRLSCTELQLVVDGRSLLQLQIISIGSEADRLLQHVSAGRVLATFERSFYVQCEQGIFCVGLASLGEGPLHVLLKSNRNLLPIHIGTGLSVCMKARLPQRAGGYDDRLVNGDKRTVYSGKVSSKALSVFVVQRLQHRLGCVVPLKQKQQGFGWIVSNAHWQEAKEPLMTGCDSLQASLRKQCYPALLSLSRWLEKSLVTYNEKHLKTPVPTDISALLGAGPGLTPAGDDLLAGVMLALHRIDRVDLAALIRELLDPFLVTRTSAISGAHLRLAALGQCSSSVLELLDNVFDQGCVNSSDLAHRAATDIQWQANQIGASSGWDMLAGMSLVLRAL